jgi:5-methylcytosine-specific restriction endonuclease McrA
MRVVAGKYGEYMRSEDWSRKREKILARDKRRCTSCGGIQNLHVHRLTYNRLGHERLTDLITLCDICHDKEHEQLLALRTRHSVVSN